MRTFFNIVIIQLLLSAIAAMLMAQMSWVGRMSISIFYKDYAILKDPVQSGIAIFLVQLMVIILLHLLYVGISRKATRTISAMLFVVAAIGLAYTIYDFTEEFTYKMLKYKFHIGFYLIWIGFMFTTLYYFFLPPKNSKLKEPTL